MSWPRTSHFSGTSLPLGNVGRLFDVGSETFGRASDLTVRNCRMADVGEGNSDRISRFQKTFLSRKRQSLRDDRFRVYGGLPTGRPDPFGTHLIGSYDVIKSVNGPGPRNSIN